MAEPALADKKNTTSHSQSLSQVEQKKTTHADANTKFNGNTSPRYQSHQQLQNLYWCLCSSERWLCFGLGDDSTSVRLWRVLSHIMAWGLRLPRHFSHSFLSIAIATLCARSCIAHRPHPFSILLSRSCCFTHLVLALTMVVVLSLPIMLHASGGAFLADHASRIWCWLSPWSWLEAGAAGATGAASAAGAAGAAASATDRELRNTSAHSTILHYRVSRTTKHNWKMVPLVVLREPLVLWGAARATALDNTSLPCFTNYEAHFHCDCTAARDRMHVECVFPSRWDASGVLNFRFMARHHACEAACPHCAACPTLAGASGLALLRRTSSSIESLICAKLGITNKLEFFCSCNKSPQQ